MLGVCTYDYMTFMSGAFECSEKSDGYGFVVIVFYNEFCMHVIMRHQSMSTQGMSLAVAKFQHCCVDVPVYQYIGM